MFFKTAFIEIFFNYREITHKVNFQLYFLKYLFSILGLMNDFAFPVSKNSFNWVLITVSIPGDVSTIFKIEILGCIVHR